MKICCIRAFAFVCTVLLLLTGCSGEPEIISGCDIQPSSDSSVCYAPPKPGEYGYVFRFVRNADGTDFTIDDNEQLTAE